MQERAAASFSKDVRPAIADEQRSNILKNQRIWFESDAEYSPRDVAPLRHSYGDHPLLQLPRLQQLAESLLASGQCKFIAPDATPSSPFDTLTRDPKGKSLADVFAQIEKPGSWIALYNVETDPEYRQFLWDAAATARSLIDQHDPGIFHVGGFIFISAPPSVTPFHIDRENNLWLQIRGRKRINVWNPADRVVVTETAVEDFIVNGTLETVNFREELRGRSFEREMGPGEGVYMPSTAPHMTDSGTHWVVPGDGVSLSIGIVFYTAATRRAANIYALNKFIRRCGLTPTPPGQSRLLDAFKYPVAWMYVRARKLLRGYQLRFGM